MSLFANIFSRKPALSLSFDICMSSFTLAMNNMLGTLPPELHHLQYLKTIFISENEFLSGEIPFQYGWLKHLNAREFTTCKNDGMHVMRTKYWI